MEDGGWRIKEGGGRRVIAKNKLGYLNFSSECLSLNVARYCSVGRLLLQ